MYEKISETFMVVSGSYYRVPRCFRGISGSFEGYHEFSGSSQRRFRGFSGRFSEVQGIPGVHKGVLGGPIGDPRVFRYISGDYKGVLRGTPWVSGT